MRELASVAPLAPFKDSRAIKTALGPPLLYGALKLFDLLLKFKGVFIHASPLGPPSTKQKSFRSIPFPFSPTPFTILLAASMSLF
jgi:hypothetical protein